MFYLFLFIAIFIAILIFAIKLGVQVLLNQSATSDIENLKPFLCSVSKLRKKDGNVKRGDCTITFEDNLFFIIQDEEKIENEIESIYYFDIWDYKDETYFKICMRSHIEYIFKSIRFEADKIADFLKTKGVKIEDNRE